MIILICKGTTDNRVSQGSTCFNETGDNNVLENLFDVGMNLKKEIMHNGRSTQHSVQNELPKKDYAACFGL